MHLYQSGLLRSILLLLCEACTVGLIEYLSKLMLICAQSGRVSGLVKKNDPATSSRSDMKELKDINNRLLVIFNKFCGGADRTANLRVKHLNSDIEQTRRGIVLLVFLIM